MIREEPCDPPANPGDVSISSSETVINTSLFTPSSVTPLVGSGVDAVSTALRQFVKQVGRYRILDLLGQGGMASVYRRLTPLSIGRSRSSFCTLRSRLRRVVAAASCARRKPQGFFPTRTSLPTTSASLRGGPISRWNSSKAYR